ncbi:MAG: fumarylacetoacetate hydrolase family protein [Acidimicrobiia bacterium]|nr:fumarylacetoacetate hydrolase family protein [Acidimicrobiia bacterium]
MRFCRFGDGRLGVVEGTTLRDVTAALDVLPAYRYPLPSHDPFIANLAQVTARAKLLLASAPAVPAASVPLLSPVANPGKLIAAPVNYQKHLEEVKSDKEINAGNPAHSITIHSAGLFLKANSSLVGPGEGVAVRKPDRRTDHEVELAFVIGREARNVSKRDALSYIAGYTIGLDITIRGSEDRSFRKSPDSYSVLGPWLVTADEIPDPGGLDLQVAVNGTQRQKSNTRYLILGVPELVELASSFYTLYPGDVIFTGTPEGVSPIQPGDEIVASIDRIGSMTVAVRTAEGADAALTGAAATART